MEGRSDVGSDMTANERLGAVTCPTTCGCYSSASRRLPAAPSSTAPNSKLYDATREAFEAAIPALRREDDFLAAFQRLGCYLDDVYLKPVNDLDMRDPERLAEGSVASCRLRAG